MASPPLCGVATARAICPARITRARGPCRSALPALPDVVAGAVLMGGCWGSYDTTCGMLGCPAACYAGVLVHGGIDIVCPYDIQLAVCVHGHIARFKCVSRKVDILIAGRQELVLWHVAYGIWCWQAAFGRRFLAEGVVLDMHQVFDTLKFHFIVLLFLVRGADRPGYMPGPHYLSTRDSQSAFMCAPGQAGPLVRGGVVA